MQKDIHLDDESVYKQWKRNGVINAIRGMEQCETWTIDKKREAEEAISLLCDKLNNAPPDLIKKAVDSNMDGFIEMMGFMRSSKALALFRWLAESHPETISQLIDQADNDIGDFAVLMVERITVLERIHLLSRVFSPQRTALVIEMLENMGLKQELE